MTALRHDIALAGGATLGLAAALAGVGYALLRAGAGRLVARKVPHALCGVFAALAAFQLSSMAAIVAVLAVATVALVVLVEMRLVPDVLEGTRSRDYGLVGFAAGALVAVIGFWPDRVSIAAGLLVLGLADAGAALIGQRFGRRQVEVGGAVRSLEGSAFFVAVTFGIAFICAFYGFKMTVPVAVAVSAFVAVTTAAIELLVMPALDNFLITPWVALLLHVGHQLEGAGALRWLGAAVFGCVIVPFMVRMRWLDLPGAICGGLIAAGAVGLGGWPWIIPAAVFFAATSVLTGYRRPTAHGGLRTLSQVAVNAGLPVLAPVVGYALTGNQIWFCVSIGGIAAGIADTWASEIGRFSTKLPISVRTGSRVPKGTSGAVSPLGSVATVLGGLAVGAFGALFAGPALVVVGLAAGTLGSALDTVLGATVQGRFRCASCHAVVEDRQHCGLATELGSGWRWMGNNTVNALANLTGMGVAFGAFTLIIPAGG